MTGALEPRSNDLIHVPVPGVRVLPQGLEFTELPSYDELRVVLSQVGVIRDWSAWAIGDALVVGEMVHGDAIAQAAEVLRRDPDTILEFQRVAARFPHRRRRASLSWSHHQAVSALRYAPEEADAWLDRAEREGWSAKQLREELSAPRRLGEVDAKAVVAAARDLCLAAECKGSWWCEVPTERVQRLRELLRLDEDES